MPLAELEDSAKGVPPAPRPCSSTPTTTATTATASPPDAVYIRLRAARRLRPNDASTWSGSGAFSDRDSMSWSMFTPLPPLHARRPGVASPGPRQVRADRPGGAPERVGDLLIGLVEQIAQHDGGLLLRGHTASSRATSARPTTASATSGAGWSSNSMSPDGSVRRRWALRRSSRYVVTTTRRT